jgi:hypothetical protein
VSRSAASWIFAVSAIATVVAEGRVEASPQISSTLAVGAAGNGDRSHLWNSTDFAVGLRGELLLGRGRDADFGVGPYLEALTTTGFSDMQWGGGATLLVPVHSYLPLTVSAGGYATKTDAWGWQPGLAGELFWGSHGYNYGSIYALTAGIFAGARYGVGSSRDVSIVLGARIDLEFLALPAILVWNAIRGSDPTR